MKKIKSLCMYLVLVILCSMCFLTSCSNNLSGINIHHSGKGEACITIKSEDNEENFNKKLNDYIDGIKLMSGYSDVVVVKDVSKAENGYNVSVKFRRVDKIKINGEIEWKKCSEFLREESENRKSIEKYDKGNISDTLSAVYGGKLGKISILRKTIHKVSPKNISGDNIKIEDFLNIGEKLNNRNMLILVRMFDISNIEKIKITLPGNIKFIGGDNIKVLSNNELEFSSCPIKAQITKSEIVKDENGVEIINPVVETKEVPSFLGYFVFEKSLSPFEISMISIGSILGVGIIVSIFAYFIITGKKEIEKEERKNDE